MFRVAAIAALSSITLFVCAIIAIAEDRLPKEFPSISPVACHVFPNSLVFVTELGFVEETENIRIYGLATGIYESGASLDLCKLFLTNSASTQNLVLLWPNQIMRARSWYVILLPERGYSIQDTGVAVYEYCEKFGWCITAIFLFYRKSPIILSSFYIRLESNRFWENKSTLYVNKRSLGNFIRYFCCREGINRVGMLLVGGYFWGIIPFTYQMIRDRIMDINEVRHVQDQDRSDQPDLPR